MINFKEITKDNFWQVIGLEVDEKQKDFVASNVVSIAQSKLEPSCIPLAIYNDDTIVGFLMYGIDPDDGNYWIVRFMIDKKHQRKGYGKESMEKIITEIKKDKSYKRILLRVNQKNIEAKELYIKLGFKLTKKENDGKEIMELE
jgi:diamine N-acetyltransferase